MKGICPGLIVTAIWEENRQNSAGLNEDGEDHIALKRWGDGGDGADVARFFASDASRSMTGAVVAADGAMASVGSAPRPRD